MKKEIVVVDWIDVSKKTNDDSFDDSCDIDSRVSSMKTIGWLYEESEKTILLVQEFDGESPRDWIVIPKVLITKTTHGSFWEPGAMLQLQTRPMEIKITSLASRTRFLTGAALRKAKPLPLRVFKNMMFQGAR